MKKNPFILVCIALNALMFSYYVTAFCNGAHWKGLWFFIGITAIGTAAGILSFFIKGEST